jgi:hypothetical protein
MKTRKVGTPTSRLNQRRPKRRQDLAAFSKFVKTTLRRMYTGQPILMVVSVIDLKGPAIAVQTVAGHSNPPPPPNPPMMVVRNR